MPVAFITNRGSDFGGSPFDSDPALRFLFIVNAPGGIEGAFTKVTGLQEDIEVLTQRDGQNPQQVRKMPGVLGGGEVKLERGVIKEAADLIGWFSLVRRCGLRSRLNTGEVVNVRNIRQDVEISVFDCNDSLGRAREARLYRLKNAWPRRYELDELNSMTSDVAVESITLAFDELEITQAQTQLRSQALEAIDRIERARQASAQPRNTRFGPQPSAF